MKIFLWIIAIIFIVGLLTLTGVFKLIFLIPTGANGTPVSASLPSFPIAFARQPK